MTIKYINNRELLVEIQRSKATFCYFISPEYSTYDVVLTSLDQLTPTLLASTIITKASKMSTKIAPVNPESINSEAIVFRVMTDSHLPPETDEKRRKKSSTGEWVAKPNYPPFKHYIMVNDEPMEVGRSHWKESLHNGRFGTDHGKISNRLAQMFMMLCEQYSHRGNWRNYSYRDEMVGLALTHLCAVGLQFDESRSSNPFAWYTQIVKHIFTRVLNLEKRNQTIRDDLLIMAGVNPSHTRQVDNEMDQRDGYETRTVAMSDIHVVGNGNKSDPDANLIKKVPAKRGRKPKVKA